MIVQGSGTKWLVIDGGAQVAGPFRCNGDAWRWIDRNSGEPVSKAEDKADWISAQDAARPSSGSGRPRMKALPLPLPLPIKVALHKAQMAAINALAKGDDPKAVRLNMGRRLLALRKECEKGQFDRVLAKLQLQRGEARKMMDAARQADRRAKQQRVRKKTPAAIVEGKKGFWLRRGTKTIAGPFPSHREALIHFNGTPGS